MRRARSHRDPVSCQSCRAKKLKCNRTQPCNNCTIRGIDCDFLNLHPTPAHSETTVRKIEDLLQRIQRLENVVEGLSVDRAGSKHIQLPFAQQNHIGPSSVEENVDTRILEHIGVRDDLLLSDLSNDFSVEAKSIAEILDKPMASIEGAVGKVILPTYTVAMMLLQDYESSVDHVYRILHIPKLRIQMRSYYLHLARGEPVLVGHTALFAAIFSLAIFFHNSSRIGQLVPTDSDSIYLARKFSKATLDALDHSRRTTCGSIEDVQAYVLASVIIFYLDGFSARGRVLLSTAVIIARDIGLQHLDSEHKLEMPKDCSRLDLIDLEVKRRVMWHLAATDWLLSLVSGPQEGTYLIRASHMRVKLPSPHDDDGVCIGETTDNELQMSPGMTYSLERIRLAELCRTMIDRTPTDSALPSAYEFILAADRDMLEYLKSLPYFFKLDSESRMRAKDLEIVHPTLGLLRYLITQTAHSRRCRLHQRFLLRRSSDVRYEYSRVACLDSARIVIQSFESLVEGGCSWAMVARMGLAVHYLHLALAVFVMDLCCNPTAADRVDIENDLLSAMFKMEGLRDKSALVDRSLSSLHRVLRKYGIRVDDRYILNDTTSGFLPEHTQQVTAFTVASGNDRDQRNEAGAGIVGNASDTYFSDVWESAVHLEQGEDEWSSFFDRFDNHLL